MSQLTNRYHGTNRSDPSADSTIPPTSLINVAELALNVVDQHRLVELVIRLSDIGDQGQASSLIDEEGQRITAAFLTKHAEHGWGWDGDSGWGEDDWDIESTVVHQLNQRLNTMASACARSVAARAAKLTWDRSRLPHDGDHTGVLMGLLSERLERSSLPGFSITR